MKCGSKINRDKQKSIKVIQKSKQFFVTYKPELLFYALTNQSRSYTTVNTTIFNLPIKMWTARAVNRCSKTCSSFGFSPGA